MAIVSEYSYYVAAIASGRSLALAYLFLSLLYRGFFTIIEQLKSKEDIKTVLGILWFLPLWIYQYFSEFVPVNCSDISPLKNLFVYKQIL